MEGRAVGLVMDLVAGDNREILLALAMDDLAAFDDPGRFAAHLTFGGAVDPTWLDLFSEAVRSVTGTDAPMDFLEARTEIDGPGGGDRTLERVDPAWVGPIARLTEHELDAVTGRWIDLLEEELGDLPREEKPSIRKFARDIAEFARSADRAPSIILAWSL
jgi:hypothetical protein